VILTGERKKVSIPEKLRNGGWKSGKEWKAWRAVVIVVQIISEHFMHEKNHLNKYTCPIIFYRTILNYVCMW
jgi:hypothetical protein